MLTRKHLLVATVVVLAMIMLVPLGRTGGAQEAISDPDSGAKTTEDEHQRDLEPELINVSSADYVTVFKRIAGISFHNVGATWQYDSNTGCVYSGYSFVTVDLQVPDGAIIDNLTVYYYDADVTHDLQVTLHAYDGQGGHTAIASVSGGGNAGYGSAESAYFEHEVDNLSEALAVVADLGEAGDALRFCGVRIRYQIPYSVLRLPLILKQVQP